MPVFVNDSVPFLVNQEEFRDNKNKESRKPVYGPFTN